MYKMHSTILLSTHLPFWTGILSHVSKNDDEKTLLLKVQLISKRFSGLVDFLQKTNKNMSHSSKNEFIRSFFGRIHSLMKLTDL